MSLFETKIYIVNIQKHLISNFFMITLFILIEYLSIIHGTIKATFHISKYSPPKVFTDYFRYLSVFDILRDENNDTRFILMLFFILMIVAYFIYRILLRFETVKNSIHLNYAFINFYEHFFFRILLIIIFDLEVEGLFSDQVYFIIICLVLLFITFFVSMYKLEEEYIYFKFNMNKYLFTNKLCFTYEVHVLFLKILLCFSKNIEMRLKNIFLQKTTDLLILGINFWIMLRVIVILIFDSFVLLSPRASIFIFLQTFMTILSINMILMKNISDFYFSFQVVVFLFLSLCFTKILGIYSNSKLYMKDNEILPLVNLIDNYTEKKKDKNFTRLMESMIDHHHLNCHSKECRFCIKITQIKKEKELEKEKFIKIYFKYLVSHSAMKSKNSKKFLIFHSILELYIYFFLKNQSLLEITRKYQKTRKFFRLTSQDQNITLKVKMKNTSKFYRNFDLLYQMLVEKITSKNSDLKKFNFLIEADKTADITLNFFEKLNNFLKMGLNSPVEVQKISKLYTELKDKYNKKYFNSRDIKLHYQIIVIQYVSELIFNEPVMSTNYSVVDIAHTYDDIFEFAYKSDRILLVSFDVSLNELKIREASRELNELKGKDFFKLFPSIFHDEVKKRIFTYFVEKKKKPFYFYRNDAKKLSVEGIKLTSLIIPHVSYTKDGENNTKEILYLLLNFKLLHKKIMIFQRNETKLNFGKMMLIALSESLQKIFGIQQPTINDLIENKTPIFVDDILREEKDSTRKLRKNYLQKRLKKLLGSRHNIMINRDLNFRLEEAITTNFIYYEIYIAQEEHSGKFKGSLMEDKDDYYPNESNNSTINLSFNEVAHTAISSSTLTGSTQSEYIKQNKRIKEQSNTQYKKFFVYTYYLIIFNSFQIIIVVIFLAIQLMNNSSLKNIFTAITTFNLFRSNLFHTVLSIFCLTCNADYVGQTDCYNQFGDLSLDFINQYNLSDKESISDYVQDEVIYKTSTVISSLNEWMTQKQAIDSKELSEITVSTFSYASVHEVNGKVSIVTQEVSFTDSIKMYSNIINLLGSMEVFFTSPIYSITINPNDNWSIDMSNVSKNRTAIDGFFLNESQRYYYSVIINYLRYLKRLINVRDIIYEYFNTRTNYVSTQILIFDVVFIFMDILMMLLVFKFVFLFRKIHFEYYFMIYNKIVDKDFVKYFKEKVETLEEMLCFYKGNPNSQIGKIEKIKKKESSRRSNLIKAAKEQSTEITTLQIQQKSNQINSNKNEHKNLIINRYITKTLILFIVYMLLVLVFFFILKVRLDDLKLMNKYSRYQFDITNQLYMTLTMVQMMTLGNLTDTEIYDYFKTDGNGKGYVRENLESTISLVLKVEQLEKNNIEFTQFSKLVDIQCETLYNSMNDSLVNKMFENYPESKYEHMLSIYCSTFQAIALYQNDKLGINYISYKISQLLDMFVGESYEIYAAINNSELLYNLYAEVLLLVRPIRDYILNFLREKVVINITENYIIFIIIFIILNFIYEAFLFLYVKIIIIDKVIFNSKEIIQLAKAFECL